MITLVNFADKKFETQRWWNSVSAKLIGGFDKVLEYGPADLDDSFISSHKHILHCKKGYGNYCWKPYIINRALEQVKDEDYLFYADSGSFFIKSIKPLVEILKQGNKDMMCFRLPLIEKQWTKRDALILMDCDDPEYYNTAQVMGTFILVKKSEVSVRFFKKFEELSVDSRIISDEPNVLGKENYPGFIAHRHDQSILSLMAKKNGVTVADDPSDYGLFPKRYIRNDKSLFDPNLMNPGKGTVATVLLNRKVHPFIYLLKHMARITLYKSGIVKA